MTLLQADRESVHRFVTAAGSPGAYTADHLIGARAYLRALVGTLVTIHQRWWAARRVRDWRTMAERGRQRRALARLSDRELSDIGINRYEVEFLLRQPRNR
jgi:uncharacterized protein YjiS (DUF1127 family)